MTKIRTLSIREALLCPRWRLLLPSGGREKLPHKQADRRCHAINFSIRIGKCRMGNISIPRDFVDNRSLLIRSFRFSPTAQSW